MNTNLARLLDRIESLYKISPQRLALSKEDKLGRDLLCKWMTDIGLKIEIDELGNIFGFRFGRTKQCIMIGSHIDTVKNAGKYDGILGVLSGLEIAESLNENSIDTEKTLVIASFTNEEGVRYTPDMMGSLFCAGGIDKDIVYQLKSTDMSVDFKTELDEIGYLGAFKLNLQSIDAFLELHIEQGPVLEHENLDLGIVEGVQGIYWAEIEIEGIANHAGTTPKHLRYDALRSGINLINSVYHFCDKIEGQLVTVGKFEPLPNVINIVPAKLKMTLDLRNPNKAKLDKAIAHLKQSVDELSDLNIKSNLRELVHFDPVGFDQHLLADIEILMKENKCSYKRMVSGAGHDAQMFARVVPAAMIFIPSKNGISHNQAEYSSPEQIEKGLKILTQLVLKKLKDSDS